MSVIFYNGLGPELVLIRPPMRDWVKGYTEIYNQTKLIVALDSYNSQSTRQAI